MTGQLDRHRIARHHFDNGELKVGKPLFQLGRLAGAAGECGFGYVRLFENALDFQGSQKFGFDDEDPQVCEHDISPVDA